RQEGNTLYFEVIDDTSGKNKIQFGEGISPDSLQIEISQNGSDLILRYGDDGVYITGGANSAIETVEFADGQALTMRQLFSLYVDTPVNRYSELGEQRFIGGYQNDEL